MFAALSSLKLKFRGTCTCTRNIPKDTVRIAYISIFKRYILQIMPIMKEPQSCIMKESEAASKTSLVEETPDLHPDNSDSWPQLPVGQDKGPAPMSIIESDESSDEWENLSSDEAMDDVPKELNSPIRETNFTNTVSKNIVHRCMSTPELSHLHDEDSYVIDCSESVDDQSLATTSSFANDAVLLSHKKKNTPAMKKVPSFKDIIMLNAQARADEEKKKKEMVVQHQHNLRKEAAERRKANRPKLVISAIKRCTKSTGDLRSMIIHEEPEDGEYDGGGGGGGVIHEHDVLGDTDAMEFYSRKSKGSLNRQNGSKTRPDEAKRKEMIIHKKNAQRKAQQARAANGK